jgi:hypothetical protein
LGEIIQK